MKKWYLSKTIWLNVISTVVAVTALGLFPMQVEKILIAGVAVANIILRIWFTNTEVEKSIV